jgi:hypothetical protein
MTESAGVMVYLAEFRQQRVLWEGSLPYVTIDHQRDALMPEDAPTDAHGPFWTPLGHRSQVGPTRVERFRGGFELIADFAVGPYHYTQLWRFHASGRLAPWLIIHRGGLHERHTYHPHWRFDFDLAGAANDAIEHWTGGQWTRIEHETWLPYTGDASPDGAVWRQLDLGTGVEIALRPHHWEDAELFAIRYRDGEWGPHYPHGEAGGQPFPAAYVGAEPLSQHDVALWYVGHVHYDAAFPYTAGPWVTVRGR